MTQHRPHAPAPHDIGGGDTRSLLVGTSPRLRLVVERARQLARTDLPLLLVGDTGTGKELLASEIHRASGRPGLLVDVNCAALPREMVESILFGHRRGAFTGAHEDARGLIEASDRGTLFLDEIQSLSPEAQPKLLRVLEGGEVRRLGDTSKRQIRMRTVAAAQPGILDAVREGTFRQDLLQRIAGAVIRLPALADRVEDVPLLARHFAMQSGVAIAEDAVAYVSGLEWPGNVRELRLVIERSACLAESGRITRATVEAAQELSLTREPGIADMGGGGLPTRERVVAACAAHGWNAEATARALGLGRTTLFKHLRSLGISLREERATLEHRI